MKSFFLLLPLLVSCSFYCDNRDVFISGLSKGQLVVTSIKSYDFIECDESDSLLLSVPKERFIYITFYPDFYGSLSRYPFGAVITGSTNKYKLSPQLGSLTSTCNSMNLCGLEIDNNNMELLIKKFNESEDPWIYDITDLTLSLKGEISCGSISKFRKLIIPELDQYCNWEAENSLFSGWYCSIQSFYNENTGEKYRVEITEEGEYMGF